jgi:hypothetical protein
LKINTLASTTMQNLGPMLPCGYKAAKYGKPLPQIDKGFPNLSRPSAQHSFGAASLRESSPTNEGGRKSRLCDSHSLARERKKTPCTKTTPKDSRFYRRHSTSFVLWDGIPRDGAYRGLFDAHSPGNFAGTRCIDEEVVGFHSVLVGLSSLRPKHVSCGGL